MTTHPASPTVFVSSTISDFADLRSALTYLLTQQGVQTQVSESAAFSIRGDRAALEECFENIRNSDFFVLIVGNAYGSTYRRGISVTRQEYRVAREHFATTGFPRLLLFIRESTVALMKQSDAAQLEAKVENPVQLRSFKREIERAHGPSFLRRFRDFTEVATAITTTLNLGRNLTESLTRQAVLSELCTNLATMVTRLGHGPGVFVSHWPLRDLHREVHVSADNRADWIFLDKRQRDHLGMGLVPRQTAHDFHVKTSEEALNRGVFLRFTPATGTFEEEPVHIALRDLVDDVRSLESYGSEWHEDLMNDLVAQPNGGRFRNHHVALALSYYRRMENLFNSHLSVAKALLTGTREVQAVQRLSPTPYGRRMEWRIAKERVSPQDVRRLIQLDIWPFGRRPLRDSFGESPEERIETVKGHLRATLEEVGIPADEEVLDRSARSFLGKLPGDEEGLPDPGPEPDDDV